MGDGQSPRETLPLGLMSFQWPARLTPLRIAQCSPLLWERGRQPSPPAGPSRLLVLGIAGMAHTTRKRATAMMAHHPRGYLWNGNAAPHEAHNPREGPPFPEVRPALRLKDLDGGDGEAAPIPLWPLLAIGDLAHVLTTPQRGLAMDWGGNGYRPTVQSAKGLPRPAIAWGPQGPAMDEPPSPTIRSSIGFAATGQPPVLFWGARMASNPREMLADWGNSRGLAGPQRTSAEGPCQPLLPSGRAMRQRRGAAKGGLKPLQTPQKP
jgi:hypothetical protein